MELVVERTLGMQIPKVESKALMLALGLVNHFFFGVGVIIAGILNKDNVDVLIGILQLCVPYLGWVWAVFWGMLMIFSWIKNR
jgi:hypothetical protein